MSGRRRWLVTLEALPDADPDAAPPDVRLRRALKCLLRSFRLKCVAVEDEDAECAGKPEGDA